MGRWDEANKEKVRLEEKQRAVRRMREQEAELATQVSTSVMFLNFSGGLKVYMIWIELCSRSGGKEY